MNKLADIDIEKSFLGNSSPNLADPTGVSVYVANIVTASISISGIILLFLLIGGGIAIISGAGKSDPRAVESGKKAASTAVIGFIVVFSAYWIVKLIEAITGISLLSI